MLKRKRAAAAVIVGTLIATGVAVGAIAPIKPYTVGIAGGYETKRLLSAGDTVPETSDRSAQYRMIGIPDGLGAHKSKRGVTVFMNHELTFSTQSEPNVGGPLNRGAFVSKLTLDKKGNVISGERAYDTIFNENTLAGPAPEVGNATRPFSRFCSGSLAGPEHGFDRYIYITGEEEANPANSFDGKGGLAVAIFDNELHTLPKIGRFSWENTLIQPKKGTRTVAIGMEDGPAAQAIGVENSQLYMYVGTKERNKGASVLRRNGLDNGELYVLAPAGGAPSEETVFQNGVIAAVWKLIPNAEDLDEAQLEAASDAANAFRFARTEDGAFNKRNPNEYVFVSTGEAPGADTLGRLWSLNLHPGDPLRPATLEVLYNADQVVAAGGDIAVSPDNLDVSDEFLMINEDGTASSRPVMTSKNRDGSIWRFDIDEGGVDVASSLRVAELDPPGRDGVPTTAGIWETSGIIDAPDVYGDNTWLFDVQAHPPTAAPPGNTVEDGQLLLLTGPDGGDEDDEDDDD